MKKYDLEVRTLNFSEKLIIALKTLPQNIINYKLVKQAISAGTSIGANYMEANGAVSKKDFNNKIHISLKEARETKYWLNLLATTNPEKQNELSKLLSEVNELILIFGKIRSTLKK